ncbi:MAG TPA: hypothetical protein VJY62_22695 [Bacteroidia bacterium]|nr:hypothetical protein [Bacteroidia bacterium]
MMKKIKLLLQIIAICIYQQAAAQCGEEWWEVKTLQDVDVNQVNFFALVLCPILQGNRRRKFFFNSIYECKAG